MAIVSPIDAQQFLSEDQYIKEQVTKHQVVLHHTAGGHHPGWTIEAWQNDPERVATALVIGGISTSGNQDASFDGQIYQAFRCSFWSWHLGFKGSQGVYDKASVGIETCNYGQLTLSKTGTFFNYVNKPVPKTQVTDLGFVWRGFRYWHSYTDKQIQAIVDSYLWLIDNFPEIKKRHRKRVIGLSDFDFDPNKFSKESLAFHCNYRRDKVDMYPCPRLIAAINKMFAEN